MCSLDRRRHSGYHDTSVLADSCKMNIEEKIASICHTTICVLVDNNADDASRVLNNSRSVSSVVFYDEGYLPETERAERVVDLSALSILPNELCGPTVAVWMEDMSVLIEKKETLLRCVASSATTPIASFLAKHALRHNLGSVGACLQ